MGTELALPKGFGTAAAVLAGRSDGDELGAGIQSSYGVVGFRGKVWSIKHGGKETPLMREDGDGPRGSIEVVIVKASAAISKIFYANGYQDGSSSPPDCWSTNGLTPDPAAQNKQSATCAACPKNAWGSRVTESGKQGKACSDSRRLAVVPLNDLDNEAFGGPMLLRIPAASLKELKAYGELLKQYQHVPYGVATRISFDPAEAYPKFVFKALRPLTEDEARSVLALRDSKRVAGVLNEAHEAAPQHDAIKALPSSPFEEDEEDAPPPKAAPKAAAPKPAAPKAAPKAAPVEAAAAPASFDSMLDDIL